MYGIILQIVSFEAPRSKIRIIARALQPLFFKASTPLYLAMGDRVRSVLNGDTIDTRSFVYKVP